MATQHQVSSAGWFITTLTVIRLLSSIFLNCLLILVILAIATPVRMTLRDTHVMVEETTLTMKNVRETTAIWKRASDEQSTQTTKLLTDGSKTLASLRTFIGDADTSVNSTMASLQAAIEHQDAALSASQEALRQNLAEMQKATVALSGTLADADKTIADPHVRETIEHLDEASAELAKTSRELTAMMQSGQATAADLQRVADKFAAEYTKTRNLAFALFKELLGLGSQAVQFVK